MVAGSKVANHLAAKSKAAGSGLPTPGSAPHSLTHTMKVLLLREKEERARARARACVDCGLDTGNFCDGGMSCAYDKCFAAERVPADYKMNGQQRTPLCSYCETLHEFCRFCRGVHSCTPPIVQSHWSGVPQSKSREFNALVAAKARARQLRARTSETNERSTSETLLQHLDHVLPRVANPEIAVDNVDQLTCMPDHEIHMFNRMTAATTEQSEVANHKRIRTESEVQKKVAELCAKYNKGPFYMRGGTTVELAVCDMTPHRFLAGRYRDAMLTPSEREEADHHELLYMADPHEYMATLGSGL